MDVFIRCVFRLSRQVPSSFGKSSIVRGDRPSATGCNRFVAVEAETGNVGKLSQRFRVVSRAERLSCVVHNLEIEFASELHQRLQVHWMPQQMHRHDCTHTPTTDWVFQGAIDTSADTSKEVAKQLDIHLPVIRFRIDKNRNGSGIPNRVCRRDKCQAGDEHLISGFHATNQQRCVQRARSVDRCDSELRSRSNGDFLFEPLDE